MRDPVQINYEKNGFRVSVETSLSSGEIKKRLADAADSVPMLYVPAELQWENGGYAFTIRGRQSLKESLLKQEKSMIDFHRFVEQLALLHRILEERKIPLTDVIWEYDCIFTGESFDYLEFVYIPGARRENIGHVITDLFSLVSLHLTVPSGSRDASSLQHFLRWCSSWEESGTSSFPVEEALSMLSLPVDSGRSWKRMEQGWGLFALVQGAAGVLFAFLIRMVPFRQMGILLWIGWGAALLCADYLLFPVFQHLNILTKWFSARLVGQGQMRGFVQLLDEDGVCRIGRNGEWADVLVTCLFVSRCHAEIKQDGTAFYLVDLASRNGTYIDGRRLEPQKRVLLQDGMSFWLGGNGVYGLQFLTGSRWRWRFFRNRKERRKQDITGEQKSDAVP